MIYLDEAQVDATGTVDQVYSSVENAVRLVSEEVDTGGQFGKLQGE